MQTASKALQLLDELEKAKPQAINELIAAKEDIEAKLARLQGNGPEKPKRKKSCSVCGAGDHNARKHGKEPE